MNWKNKSSANIWKSSYAGKNIWKNKRGPSYWDYISENSYSKVLERPPFYLSMFDD